MVILPWFSHIYINGKMNITTYAILPILSVNGANRLDIMPSVSISNVLFIKLL